MIVYLRYTDHKNSWVRWHQVWDRDLFVKSQRASLIDEEIIVGVISEDDYRRDRWPNYQRSAA